MKRLNMKGLKQLLILTLCVLPLIFNAQITKPEVTEVWDPEPRTVNTMNDIPEDAIILFNGEDLNAWQGRWDKEVAQWKVEDGAMTVVKGTGDIMTKDNFGSCQLHVEWRTPAEVVNEGQLRGNSGVFLQSRYEVQVLDSYMNRTYSNGQAGSIYKQHLPLVNACRPPGEWQSYDIIFTAPVFNQDSMKIVPAYMTVIQNGVVIQNHVEIYGTTEYIGMPKNPMHGPSPIVLQDHGDPVSYRNIWIRKLD